MNVAEAVGRTLAELGVAQAFGVVGSGNFEVTNALRAYGVPFVAARHEGGAATMADAYARMSDRVTAVTLHQGCGLTNAMTGITEAAKSRTPMIVLAADVPTGATASNFRIDQNAVVNAVGAVSRRVTSAETVVEETFAAVETAVHDRRTVVLNLPLDVQAQPAELTAVAPLTPPVMPAPHGVEDLIEVLQTADRPVFIAGRGARGAGPAVAELAGKVGALLATSAVAHGLFHGSPWNLGISGGFATPLAASLIADADVVVAWGCSLTKWTTRQGRLLADKVIVQVDLDPQSPDAKHRIHGDVGEVARLVADVAPSRTGYRTEELRAWLAGPQWAYDDLSTSNTIDPRTLTIRLDELLPRDRIVAVDSGNFMGYPAAHLSVPDQYGFCFTQAFQSIGLGLATGLGAALARPDRLPVAAVGDGGFLMSIAELETVARLELPMVIVVYNDNAYGAEVHHFGDADMGAVSFPDTDIAAIARGYGCHGLTVRTVEDLNDLVLDGRPVVIDAKITGDGGSWWLQDAFS
ncbi:thiamine pyrophosphate-binding protein [Actinocrispum sp. NPDC049592]|uniref:thiamine pyrophosphate-binding protein n=1 Tax=Actinocrispum sp. NPDC049592 TaxID=3154835 RepID=UPI00342F2B75